jgi:hypothetical protein
MGAIDRQPRGFEQNLDLFFMRGSAIRAYV